MSVMVKSKPAEHVDELADALERMQCLYISLKDCLADKLVSLRRADLQRVEMLSARERSLAAQVIEQESARRRIMEHITRPYGISTEQSRTMRVRDLTERLGHIKHGRLCAAAQCLKSAIVDAQAAAALLERVSRDVLGHVREVFAALGGLGADGGGYGPRGATRAVRSRELFEAVG